jgi:hypothetical protein
MDDPTEYAALAEQAERLEQEAPDRRIAGSWRQIASGFRELARLRAASVRRWRDRTTDSDDGQPLRH